MLCQFLLYNKVNQLYVYIYPHIPSPLSLPPTLPIPSLQVVTKHRVDLLVLCSSFPLAIHFTFGSVYMSMLLSHCIPASPSRPVPSSPLSTSLILPCHQVLQYCFFLIQIYLFIYLFYLFGCIGSSLLPVGFLQLRQAAATLRCSLWASHCGVFSCRSTGSRHAGFSSCCT